MIMTTDWLVQAGLALLAGLPPLCEARVIQQGAPKPHLLPIGRHSTRSACGNPGLPDKTVIDIDPAAHGCGSGELAVLGSCQPLELGQHDDCCSEECDPGQWCHEGNCEPIQVVLDPFHCGSLEPKACDPGSACINGVCHPLDFEEDAFDCGDDASSQTCRHGSYCWQGECSPITVGSSEGLVIGTDSYHCGPSETACPAGSLCISDQCVELPIGDDAESCRVGHLFRPGTFCYESDIIPIYIGTDKTSCSSGEVSISGVCVRGLIGTSKGPDEHAVASGDGTSSASSGDRQRPAGKTDSQSVSGTSGGEDPADQRAGHENGSYLDDLDTTPEDDESSDSDRPPKSPAPQSEDVANARPESGASGPLNEGNEASGDAADDPDDSSRGPVGEADTPGADGPPIPLVSAGEETDASPGQNGQGIQLDGQAGGLEDDTPPAAGAEVGGSDDVEAPGGTQQSNTLDADIPNTASGVDQQDAPAPSDSLGQEVDFSSPERVGQPGAGESLGAGGGESTPDAVTSSGASGQDAQSTQDDGSSRQDTPIQNDGTSRPEDPGSGLSQEGFARSGEQPVDDDALDSDQTFSPNPYDGLNEDPALGPGETLPGTGAETDASDTLGGAQPGQSDSELGAEGPGQAAPFDGNNVLASDEVPSDEAPGDATSVGLPEESDKAGSPGLAVQLGNGTQPIGSGASAGSSVDDELGDSPVEVQLPEASHGNSDTSSQSSGTQDGTDQDAGIDSDTTGGDSDAVESGGDNRSPSGATGDVPDGADPLTGVGSVSLDSEDELIGGGSALPDGAPGSESLVETGPTSSESLGIPTDAGVVSSDGVSGLIAAEDASSEDTDSPIGANDETSTEQDNLGGKVDVSSPSVGGAPALEEVEQGSAIPISAASPGDGLSLGNGNDPAGSGSGDEPPASEAIGDNDGDEPAADSFPPIIIPESSTESSTLDLAVEADQNDDASLGDADSAPADDGSEQDVVVGVISVDLPIGSAPETPPESPTSILDDVSGESSSDTILAPAPDVLAAAPATGPATSPGLDPDAALPTTAETPDEPPTALLSPSDRPSGQVISESVSPPTSGATNEEIDLLEGSPSGDEDEEDIAEDGDDQEGDDCSSSSDCAAGLACENSFCIAAELTVGGPSELSAGTDFEIEADGEADEGDSCEATGDCATGLACANGICIRVDLNLEGGVSGNGDGDSDADLGEEEEEVSDDDDEAIQEDGSGEEGDDCSSSSDCASGLSCQESLCARLLITFSGSAEAGAGVDADGAAGEGEGCSSSSNCAAGLGCTDGFCFRISVAATLGAGAGGGATGQVSAGIQADGATEVGGTCSASEDCGADLTCLDGECVRITIRVSGTVISGVGVDVDGSVEGGGQCSENANCVAGLSCWESECVRISLRASSGVSGSGVAGAAFEAAAGAAASGGGAASGSGSSSTRGGSSRGCGILGLFNCQL